MADHASLGPRGPGKQATVDDSEGSRFKVRSPLLRFFFAELLGTFLLVLIGDAAIAGVTLGRTNDALSTDLGFGLGLMVAIYVSGGVSGGHVNPAVSLAMCTLGRLRWIALPVYWAAQFIGAFLGAAVVYAIYLDGNNDFEGGPSNRTMATAGIFATYPQPYLTLQEGFFDQVVGTALLVGGIVAILDRQNSRPARGTEPLMIGLLLAVIAISYGYNSGGAINPARDFSPRLFTAIVGYGTDVWQTSSGVQFWWIPIVGPLVGGPLGAWIYYLLVEVHHDARQTEADEETAADERMPLIQQHN